MKPWDTSFYDSAVTISAAISAFCGVGASATALEGMSTTPAILGIGAGIISTATVLFSVRESRARDDLQRLILETASDAQANSKVGFGS